MPRSRRFWSAAAVAVIIVVGVTWFLIQRREWEYQPAPPNAFVSELALVRTESGEAVPLSLELPQGGFYVRLEVTPDPERPQTNAGREVPDPRGWPFALRIYPRGQDSEGDQTLDRQFSHYQQSGILGEPQPPNLPWFIPVGRGSCGPEGKPDTPLEQPPTPEAWQDDHLYLWAWFGTWQSFADDGRETHVEPGDYVYEVITYPTAAWASSVRTEIGDPVVLSRGILTVTPSD